MGMRISGFASGMDIEAMVRDLMTAERMPLNRIQQNKTKIEWQRDAYRELNVKLAELDNLMLDMRLQSTYMAKKTTSSNNAVTATASANASNGSYRISVEQLATNAINASNGGISAEGQKIDPRAKLFDQIEEGKIKGFLNNGEVEFDRTQPQFLKFETYVEGEMREVEIEVTEQDTLSSVLNKITNKGVGVRAFYDVEQDRVIMERTTTGQFNQVEGGKEIEFADNGFLANLFSMQSSNETGGTNARFTYNGVELTSKTNTTTLNGITFTFNDETSSTNVSVVSDTDQVLAKITEFVDKYNELVETITGKLNEPAYRSFHPLSEEEMRDMSEREIEMWDEKARSGLLRRDPVLSNALTEMRMAWTGMVKNDSQYNHFSQIGINTTANYLDGGKLAIDEGKLREALENNVEDVFRMFSNNVDGEGKGIFHRLNDAVDKTTKQITDRAGGSNSQLHQYALGRQIRGMDSRIANFERRLEMTENRYWRQFTAMEKAIQQFNDQSNMLYSYFNQGM
ncbi:flagellar hook-associated protein 2 [Amphibacillus marinus]|uniref:Flagellar hook-associated protein 2 n=1 Tax=Amphibacillus marinus TaxID=872970 RepID=A0A1H8QEE0_9BACI|nr:flagellar hook-associated protein 2 [Amphibacillus marinus]SEO52254.1 flagellar hook-associated protein 2 [Amphibacillus marinus]